MLALDFTFGKRPLGNRAPGPQYGEPQNSIGSDRLQKAIERNRAKQLKRERHTQAPPSRPLPGPPTPPPRPQAARPSFRSRINSQPAPSRFGSRQTPSAPQGLRNNNFNSTPRVVSQRQKAPLFNSSEIQDRIKEKLNAPLNRIKESTAATFDRTKGFIDKWSLKIGWVICLFLLARLIMSNGGLADFYSKKKLFDSRVTYKQSLQKENMDLLKEIDKIKNDMGHQKELVRRHLGYISSSEYLVLFSKDQ